MPTHLLVQRLFASPYILAQKTGHAVVPLVSFTEKDAKHIYVKIGEPINLSEKGKEEALTGLRDSLATMVYEHIACHAKTLTREELQGMEHADMDYRLAYMESRRREFLSVKWTRDVWNEELFAYSDIENPGPAEVRKSYDCIEVTKNNAYVLAPVLAQRWENEMYDFKKYMKENWDK